MKNVFGYKQSFGSVLLILIITNLSLIYVSVLLDYPVDKSKVADLHSLQAYFAHTDYGIV